MNISSISKLIHCFPAPGGGALVSGSRLSVRADDRAGISLSRAGSSLSVRNKAPSRADSKLSVSRAGSSLSVRDDKAASRAGSSLSLNVPSGGGSRASSSHSHKSGSHSHRDGDGGHSARSHKNGGDETARSVKSVKSVKSNKSTSKRSSVVSVAGEVINKINSTAEVAG